MGGRSYEAFCARSIALKKQPNRKRERASMKIVDLSHVMNVHTPGCVGYAGNKMYYAQNLQTVRIVAQRIDTALHVGTHRLPHSGARPTTGSQSARFRGSSGRRRPSTARRGYAYAR
jgi:hypothetical protein